MASTPPPLPSSDEGEFDDDDFGCFTSSAPVNAGLGSESEDDAEHNQGLSKQKNVYADSVQNSLEDSIKQTPASGNRSNVTDVICNGKKIDSEEIEAPQVTKQLESNSFEKSHDNCEDQASSCSTEGISHNENVSFNAGVDLDTHSHISTNTPIKLSKYKDPASGDETGLCLTERENGIDCISSEVKDSPSFDQETDDWADFSSAPSEFNTLSEDDQAKDPTDSQNAFEPSEIIDGKKESYESVPVAPTDFIDSHSKTLESGNPDTLSNTSETVTHIDDASNISNKEQESSCEIVEESTNSRSDNDKSEDQSVLDCNMDSNMVSESQSQSDPLEPTKEISDWQDSIDIPPSTISDDDDDDDDFGDFSDFPSHKARDSVSKEDDVAPISFRTSTCEDDDLEEGEDDHNDFGNKFDSRTETTGESPMPYGDEDDDDEDWGFKTADSRGNDIEDDDFGEFGRSNHAPSDDADWANFSESSTPKTGPSQAAGQAADFDEDEFQSPKSSMSMVTPSQQGLNKLERAVSTSFPHDGQMYFYQPASMNKTNNDKSIVEDDSMKALDSVVEMGLKSQPSAKQETWTITKELRIKDPMIGLWERLKDINACHALDFGWTTSQCSQEVYSTLHIDTKNVLFSQKKQAVPFFASGLGILEPIRGGANQPEKQNTPPPPPPLLDTSKPEQSQKDPPQDIPPVDFDWSSSGLTNPLKVFKSDTFNSGLSSLEPFAEILQKSAAARQGASDKELSAEAVSILSKIPNLSFMRSKVLMFPIKDS